MASIRKRVGSTETTYHVQIRRKGVYGELLFKRLQITDIARGNEISTGTG